MDASAYVKLNTLLNQKQAHPLSLKRARNADNDWHAIAKRVKLAKQKISAKIPRTETEENTSVAAVDDAEEATEQESAVEDAYKKHFGAESTVLSASALAAVQEKLWTKTKRSLKNLGKAVELRPNGKASPAGSANINPNLLAKFKAESDGQVSEMQQELLDVISTYEDVFLPQVELSQRKQIQSTIALHAMSHVTKTRNRVLKNNEHLSAQSKDDSKSLADSVETRDQGFTRPKILVLLPFRNSAVLWVDQLTSISLASSVENQARFQTEFGLPEDSIDKLSLPEAVSKYAPDHIANFSGNIDDSFRVGMRVTRKTLKLFSEFYSSDVIIASPLGLRMSIEKEDDSDYLSSIELVIVDQADVLTMQNWEHVQFIFNALNKIPTEAHGADFARIKPWYLDGKAPNLRQTVVLSAYETPEMRSLFSNLVNVAGKLRTCGEDRGVMRNIRRGVRQVFKRFDTAKESQSEDDTRFEIFKTETMPGLLRSAVASSGNTLIFVPSYFDFLRVQTHLQGIEDFEFACISEYSTNAEVAKARNAFLSGKLPFLIITERFHFFHRYQIRGIRQLVFYALPERPIIYQELLTLPFKHVPDSKYAIPDASEVSVEIAFSRFDQMRLSRIVGTATARRLTQSDETRFTFT